MQNAEKLIARWNTTSIAVKAAWTNATALLVFVAGVSIWLSKLQFKYMWSGTAFERDIHNEMKRALLASVTEIIMVFASGTSHIMPSHNLHPRQMANRVPAY